MAVPFARWHGLPGEGVGPRGGPLAGGELVRGVGLLGVEDVLDAALWRRHPGVGEAEATRRGVLTDLEVRSWMPRRPKEVAPQLSTAPVSVSTDASLSPSDSSVHVRIAAATSTFPPSALPASTLTTTALTTIRAAVSTSTS